MASASNSRRLMGWLIGAGAVLICAAVGVVVWQMTQPDEQLPEAAPLPSAQQETPRPEATTPAPTPSGPAADETEYDEAALLELGELDVFTVDVRLPLDEHRDDETTGLVATPASEVIPVFAEPGDEPIRAMPQELRFGGTTMPVIAEYDEWVQVLAVGRQATPSLGEAAQVTAWLRKADVELTENDVTVVVDIGDGTITIQDGSDERVFASDFAIGTPQTPTPIGRAFIMHTETVPSLEYTRGHPIIYLSEQSPTLDGFAGQSVAVTAFHYHDARSGEISNGCIRVDGDTAAALAELPPGTVVHIVQ